MMVIIIANDCFGRFIKDERKQPTVYISLITDTYIIESCLLFSFANERPTLCYIQSFKFNL